MNAEDLLAAFNVGPGDNHLTVKPAGTKQGWVKHIGPVGGRDDDDAFIGFKPVHFDKQLVQCLFAFVIAIAKACAPVTAHRVDFIDKDDARRVLFGLLKHVTHAACADADEHFNKVRTRNGEERHVRFTGNRAGEQCFTGAG